AHAGGPRSPAARAQVPYLLELAGAYGWRLIVVGVVVWFGFELLGRLLFVFVPIVLALFLARALAPVSGWLRRHRWRPGLAAATSMIGLFFVVSGVIAAIVPSLAGEFSSLRPTLTQAFDDVEDWLV